MITPLQYNPSFASIIRHNVISCYSRPAGLSSPALTHRDNPHAEAGTEAGAGHWRTRRSVEDEGATDTRGDITGTRGTHVCSAPLSDTDWSGD